MRHLLFILFLSSIAITAKGDNDLLFEYRGTKYITKVPNEVPTAPSWTPGMEEPPLTIGAAVKLAEKEYQKTFAAFGTFELHRIWLVKQGTGWMYAVTYIQLTKDITESRPGPSGTTWKTPLQVTYYITLDGNVRGPKPEGK